MKSMGKRAAWAAAGLAVRVAVAAPALADDGQAQNPPDLKKVIENARLWVLGILATVATLYLVVGAARYVLAGGDPGEVERAKATINSALKGYALAVLAPAVLTVLRGIVGG